MKKSRFAPISRIASLVIIFVVMEKIFNLAFSWSLGETMRFSTAIFGPNYALAASWVVQLGPQVFLLLGSISIGDEYRTMRKISYGAAILLNFIDTLTNIGAFASSVEAGTLMMNLSQNLRPFATAIGYIFCFVITWGEEILVLLAGVFLQVLFEVLEDLGKTPPRWFLADTYVAALYGASGATAVGIKPSIHGGRPTQHKNQQRGNKQQQQKQQKVQQQHDRRQQQQQRPAHFGGTGPNVSGMSQEIGVPYSETIDGQLH